MSATTSASTSASSGAPSFREALAEFGALTRARTQEIFLATTEEVQRSVVFGSEITGAPGQPVDTGALRASWQGRFINPSKWVLETNVAYAPYIEDGTNDRAFFTLRSKVGGFHSVKLTEASFDRIVRAMALANIGEGAGDLRRVNAEAKRERKGDARLATWGDGARA